MNKNNAYLIFCLLLFLIPNLLLANQKNQDLIMWYNAPAADWNEALPIGNGTLGAMVHGAVFEEHLQLNENTLYSGEPGRKVDINFQKSLERVRECIANGNLKNVNDIIASEWLGRAQDCYQPFGDLKIRFAHRGQVSDYRRELDLSEAVVRTSYSIDGVKYGREVFVSHTDQVIVMQLTASKKAGISCSLSLSGAHPTAKSKAENGRIVMKGQAPAMALRRTIKQVQEWGQEWMYPEIFDKEGKVIPGREPVMYGDKLNGEGTFYEGQLGVVLDGGQLQVSGDSLIVSGANSVKIILSGDTSFNGFDKSPSREGVDPSILASAKMKEALAISFERLKKSHLIDYQGLFNRFYISIGDQTSQSLLPVPERLALFSKGGDPSLAALFTQYARYLMIASSREGGQPINLQGIWNNQIIPPWASAYTMNINSEIYYWMGEAVNLAECTEPVHRFVKELAVDGKRHVAESFGYPGWTAHHNTTIWRIAQPVDNKNCSFWPMSGGWLCQQIWTHYLYSRDADFLRNYWPEMKGAAEFLSHWLVLNKDGFYTTPVGSSPENHYYPEGADYTTPFSEGAVMDIMITKELFANCIEASRILNVDGEFAAKLQTQLDRMQPYKIGSKGQLLEWDREYREQDPKHRHISHLYALSPGAEITKDKTPELFDAAKRSLEIRGDEATGWSMAWKSCCWARLKDGNHAHKILNNLFVAGSSRKAGLLPNLLASCPPFNIDGNFGGAAAIIEMLLQSHETKNIDGQLLPLIDVLPALPEAWPNGEVKGLRAAGGFEIDLNWKNNRVDKIQVRSLLGSPAVLRYLGKDISIGLKKGETKEFSL